MPDFKQITIQVPYTYYLELQVLANKNMSTVPELVSQATIEFAIQCMKRGNPRIAIKKEVAVGHSDN